MRNTFKSKQADALKFVHVTDTHLLDDPEDTFHSLNTKKSFETVLSHCQLHNPDIDFMLLTGDISQTGSGKSYELFDSVLQQCDLPVFCVPGNHDTPKLLQRVIHDCPDDSINIIQLGKFTLVLINSWVANNHHGMISQQCLQQLQDHLENSINQFNIIAIHHPPVLINSKWLDELGLKNQTEFLQIIKKHNQHALLICGHVHQEVDQQLDKLRLLATPSTCHQFKANSDFMHRLDTSSPAYRVVELKASNIIKTKVHYVD